MKSELDVSLRIQRRITAEIRRELLKTQKALEKEKQDCIIQKEQARELKKQLHVRNDDLARAEHKVIMLQQRLTNLNSEMNDIKGTRTKDVINESKDIVKRGQIQRQATTLEDVYKITGESYSKDDHRS